MNEQAATDYAALVTAVDEQTGHELLERTKHCPEFNLVVGGTTAMLTAMPGIAASPPDAALEVMRSYVHSIWYLGIQVGQRMASMPNFVVRGEDDVVHDDEG